MIRHQFPHHRDGVSESDHNAVRENFRGVQIASRHFIMYRVHIKSKICYSTFIQKLIFYGYFGFAKQLIKIVLAIRTRAITAAFTPAGEAH